MTARDTETALLARCVLAAKGGAPARDQRDANVFRLASMVIRPDFPRESTSLMQASEQYFARHPAERLSPAEVVRNEWISSLPRLRDMLSRRLGGH